MRSNRKKLVVIGNGMAGVRTLEELLKLAPDLYDITVIGAEPHPNYNRIMLSPVLAGEQTIDDIILNPLQWYAEHGISLHLGHAVTEVDRRRRVVRTADGLETGYDRLLLATGSLPFILPVPGNRLDGVIARARGAAPVVAVGSGPRDSAFVGGLRAVWGAWVWW